MRKTLLSALVALSLVSLAVLTPSQQGGSFTIQRSTIAGGGNAASGGVFTLTSVVGEGAAGMTGTGGGFGVGPGFWTVSSTGYSISGVVVQASGRGITNAAATLTGGPLVQPISIKTSRLGKFRFDDLLPGFSYTVTVAARRFTFTPNNQTVVLDSITEGLIFTSTE